MFMHPELVVDITAKSGRPPSRKPSADRGQVGAPKPPLQRKKLQLLPRSQPTSSQETPLLASDEEPEPEAPAEMSEAQAIMSI